MDIRKKIELEEKNFQHYIDLGVYDSEDVVYGEVSEIIDRIRKRDFSAMDNLIWHYTRITLLNELLNEEKEEPKDIDKEIVDTLLKKLEEPF